MFGIKRGLQVLNENRWLICQGIFAVYLLILAVMDIRKKNLHLLFLLSGFCVSAVGGLFGREIPLIMLAAGGAIGVVFMVVSKVTEEAFGYGDSILIGVMGSFLGFWNILYVLVAAFSMAAVFSGVMMIRKHFNRKSVFPFVPFLTAAYIGGMAVGAF